MLGRRRFLGALAGATAAPLTSPVASIRAGTSKPKRRLAVVTTEWRYPSHAWHMAERFLAGYPLQGKWHEPGLELVSAYGDQRPSNDLSRQRAAKFGFQIIPASRRRCAVEAIVWQSTPSSSSVNTVSTHATISARLNTPATNSFVRSSKSSRKTAACCRFSTTSIFPGNGTGPRKW